jgi:psp operon transcriptional activator
LVFDPFDSPYRLSKKMPVSVIEPSPRMSDGEGASVGLAGDIAREAAIDFKAEVQKFEIGLLKQAMDQSQFNQKKAAEALGLSYHQLRGYLRKYELLS